MGGGGGGEVVDKFFPFRIVRFCGRFQRGAFFFLFRVVRFSVGYQGGGGGGGGGRGAISFLVEQSAFQEIPKGVVSKFFPFSVVHFSVGYQGGANSFLLE